ncbi:MAG: hypothetical protein P1U34_09260 [Coxiellaceae bacterium]|nr:hypothetical protein [Coxiellaceae bacterium]
MRSNYNPRLNANTPKATSDNTRGDETTYHAITEKMVAREYDSKQGIKDTIALLSRDPNTASLLVKVLDELRQKVQPTPTASESPRQTRGPGSQG